MSEQFYVSPIRDCDRVIVARDSFVWTVSDFDGLYDHLEAIITDVVTGETDAAALKLRLLMCACTVASERQHA
jgi:hypothetical protein